MTSRDITKYLDAPYYHYEQVIKRTTDLILRNNFDGLDISFEYDNGK